MLGALIKFEKYTEMGWQTDLFCNITFNKETYNSKYEVLNRIDELKESIEYAKNHIRDLVMMTEPNKFCPEGYDTLSWLRNEVRDLMEIIEESSVELYKLDMLIENWDNCHNEKGLAIDPPEEITWKTAFLSGDFVNSIKYPKSNEIH